MTVGNALGHRLDDRGFLGGRAAVGEGQRGDVAVRRAVERARRKHQDEIDAEVFPIDRAQIGDAGGDVAAEHVDGDGLADFQIEIVRRLALQRDERLAGVVRAPPLAVDHARAGRHRARIGDAAVAAQHPARSVPRV